MENIKIVYYHTIENYFEPDIFDFFNEYWFEMLEGLENISKDCTDEEILKKVSEIKSIIVKDFQRALLKIKSKKKKTELTYEIQNIIETYNNDVDFNLEDSCNFLFLTDQYVYFNNIENHVDELLWGSLGDEAQIYETLVIVNRQYTEFHFITIATNLCDSKQTITIKNFMIEGNRIKNSIYNRKQEIPLHDFRSEDGIERLLSLTKSKNTKQHTT